MDDDVDLESSCAGCLFFVAGVGFAAVILIAILGSVIQAVAG